LAVAERRNPIQTPVHVLARAASIWPFAKGRAARVSDELGLAREIRGGSIAVRFSSRTIDSRVCPAVEIREPGTEATFGVIRLCIIQARTEGHRYPSRIPTSLRFGVDIGLALGLWHRMGGRTRYLQ
jgi:hypothetical protein